MKLTSPNGLEISQKIYEISQKIYKISQNASFACYGEDIDVQEICKHGDQSVEDSATHP